jgi:hypothetical protein
VWAIRSILFYLKAGIFRVRLSATSDTAREGMGAKRGVCGSRKSRRFFLEGGEAPATAHLKRKLHRGETPVALQGHADSEALGLGEKGAPLSLRS